MHAGCTAERLRDETGVVGNGRQPGRKCRMARLDQCILGKSRAVLRYRRNGELRLRHHRHAEFRQDLSYFRQFAGVVAGEHSVLPSAAPLSHPGP